MRLCFDIIMLFNNFSERLMVRRCFYFGVDIFILGLSRASLIDVFKYTLNTNTYTGKGGFHVIAEATFCCSAAVPVLLLPGAEAVKKGKLSECAMKGQIVSLMVYMCVRV